MKRFFTFFFALLSACTFSAYAAIVDGTCGDNLTWTLNTKDSTLTISGTGAMTDYMDYSPAPWYDYQSYIKYVTLPDGLTSIGDRVFYLCSSLTSITIPNSVTTIEDYAFYGCSSLPVENNLRYADTYLVEAVDKTLSTYSIKEGTKWIGSSAFYECSALTSITIPNSVTSIGDYAFAWCSSLAVVNVEATTPPTLGTYAVFTSSPTCNIPCGTLEVYQASDWKNVVGEFVEQCSDDSGDDGDMDKDLTIIFSDRDNNQISAQTVTLSVPLAPQIAGFTFLYWQPVAAPINDMITIQAVYEATTAAPEVYVNPANPAQKLIRNGQVYILHEEKMYTISGQVVK